jgi:hypothetical protein
MLVGFVGENPLAAKNLMAFCLGFVDNRPRFEYVDMLVDVLFHLISEILLETVALQVSVALWCGWTVFLMQFSSLEGRLPRLGDPILVEIEESFLLLAL